MSDPKVQAQRKLWYQAHKAEQNLRTREWSRLNAKRHKDLKAEWYSKNRESHLRRTALWSQNHRALKAHYRRAYRARVKGAAGWATFEQVEARLAYYGYRCIYCGADFEEVDHAIPLIRGGSNWAANLVPSCTSCNRRKHTSTWKEFVR